jgi:hypothetical protein
LCSVVRKKLHPAWLDEARPAEFTSPGRAREEQILKRYWFVVLVAFIAFCAASVPAMASSVVFNNFGPGFDYNCCIGGTLGGPASPVGWVIQANQFTALAGGSVSEIDVAIGLVVGTNGATVSLWTDNSGIPGIQLGSWDITNLPDFGTCCAVSSILGISGINVSAGASYFLMASTPRDTWDAWNFNSIGDTGLVDFTFDGGTTWHQAPGSTRYAFQVLANPVPEPGTLMLFGSGIIGLAGILRRKINL